MSRFLLLLIALLLPTIDCVNRTKLDLEVNRWFKKVLFAFPSGPLLQFDKNFKFENCYSHIGDAQYVQGIFLSRDFDDYPVTSVHIDEMGLINFKVETISGVEFGFVIRIEDQASDLEQKESHSQALDDTMEFKFMSGKNNKC